MEASSVKEMKKNLGSEYDQKKVIGYMISMHEGSLIVGFIVENGRAIVLVAESRILEGTEIAMDNGEEEVGNKILVGPYWVLAKCGRQLLTQQVYNDMNQFLEVKEAKALDDHFQIYVCYRSEMTEPTSRPGLNAGLLVALFEGANPKLFAIDYQVKANLYGHNISSKFHDDYHFDGEFHDDLEMFLHDNYTEDMTVAQAKTLGTRCLNRAARRARNEGSLSIGGPIKMAVLRPLTEAQRNAGVMVNVETTYEGEVVPEV